MNILQEGNWLPEVSTCDVVMALPVVPRARWAREPGERVWGSGGHGSHTLLSPPGYAPLDVRALRPLFCD